MRPRKDPVRVIDGCSRLSIFALLSTRTSCTFTYEFSSLPTTASLILRTRSHLDRVENTDPTFQNRSMTIHRRHQQSYDHRLRELVQKTGDPSIATDLGVPRSTATTWLHESPRQVVTLDVFDMKDPELRVQVLQLRHRISKLISLLRLLLTVHRVSGFHLAEQRIPDGRSKVILLRAIHRAREFFSLRAVLRISRLSPTRYHSWTRSREQCRLDDSSSCPQTSPPQLTTSEVRAIKAMVTSVEYRHVPTGTLAILAQRLGKVFASPSSLYKLIRQHGWRRPRLRVHPAKPKVGLRTLRPNEAWHIDKIPDRARRRTGTPAVPASRTPARTAGPDRTRSVPGMSRGVPVIPCRVPWITGPGGGIRGRLRWIGPKSSACWGA